MQLPRSYTRTVALIALLGILFTQLALALYVCPSPATPSPSHNPSHDASMQMTDDVNAMNMATGCVEIDQESPNLCLQYAQAGSQSLDRSAAYIPLMLFVLCFAFIFIRPIVRSAPHEMPAPDFLKRDTAPPLSIQHCCFRI